MLNLTDCNCDLYQNLRFYFLNKLVGYSERSGAHALHRLYFRTSKSVLHADITQSKYRIDIGLEFYAFHVQLINNPVLIALTGIGLFYLEVMKFSR